MKGISTFLLAGLLAAGFPHPMLAEPDAPVVQQSGQPGEGGLVGAGGGAPSVPQAPLDGIEPTELDRFWGSGSPSSGITIGPRSLPDQVLQELLEEKEAESSFLQAARFRQFDTSIALPTDLYTDPLKSLDGSTTLPLEGLDLSAFDLPITVNEEVATWLEFFLTKGRRFFSSWLARSTRYLPIIEDVFSEAGIPRDLAYVAMIESGYQPLATSPAQAAGMWQIMGITGRGLGLRMDSWVDERRDPERSTQAAARILRELYTRFGDWYLALAAYNAGAARVARALDYYNTRDFWTLARGSYLRPETRNYVPRLLAVVIIARNTERFGLSDLPYHPAIQYDTAVVERPTDLEVIARQVGAPLEELKLLNPELRHGRTPPRTYEVRLPVGTATLFEACNKSLSDEQRLVYRQHRVTSGQTLASIAREYGVTVTELSRMNRLSSSRLQAGMTLLVPQQEALLAPWDIELEEAEAAMVALELGPPNAPPPDASGSVRHKVKSGESLALIARRFGVSSAELQRWNRLTAQSVIVPGQELLVYPGRTPVKSSPPTRVHKVVPGENVWTIAQHYAVTAQELARFNGLRLNAPLRVGQVLDIPARGR